MELEDIKIKPLRKRIELTPDREERRPLLLKIDIRLNIVLEQLEKRRQRILEDYTSEYKRWNGKEPAHAEPKSNLWCGLRAKWSKYAAIGALLLEVVLAALIAPTIFDLPPLVASIAGIGIALILTFTIKYAVCAVFFRNCNVVHYHDKLLRLGKVSGSVSMVMLFPYYFARSAAETMVFADAALGVLSISLPFFAGSLLAAGLIADWPQRHGKAYEDVQSRQQGLKVLKAEIKMMLEEIKS